MTPSRPRSRERRTLRWVLSLVLLLSVVRFLQTAQEPELSESFLLVHMATTTTAKDTPEYTRAFEAIQPRVWSSQETISCSSDRPSITFVKLAKVASRTVWAVLQRVAHKVALRQNQPFSSCSIQSPNLAYARDLERNATTTPHLHLSFLRNPTDRLLSWYTYDRVSSAHHTPSAEALQTYVRTKNVRDALYPHFVARLGLQDKWVAGKSDGATFVQHILDTYHFVGVAERLDESLVVMSLLWTELTLNDLLYVQNEQVQGSYDPNCRYMHPVNLHTPGIQAYLESEEWRTLSQWDRLLYEKVNASLDATIATLGRERVQEQLREYRRLKEKVQVECLPKVPVRNCDEQAESPPCPFGACAQDCLDGIH